MLADGRRIPFSGYVLVSEERILDVIDRIRVAIPEELRQARRVLQEQERILAEARSRVEHALEERGLMAAVESERQRIMEQAEQEAASVRSGADEYARQVLEDLDQRLTKVLSSVRHGLETL